MAGRRITWSRDNNEMPLTCILVRISRPWEPQIGRHTQVTQVTTRMGKVEINRERGKPRESEIEEARATAPVPDRQNIYRMKESLM